ncbi:glycosyltransferase family 2 protein [Rhizobium mesoamericanum]|uniref:glycosyltransferase family 2 protein n=1 Tax=Rhizobium mesoamericanum TaxID=1079800 RepID=UPI0005624A04|nr:glycosyltransferase [Rhizobium mesoamericanum]
MLSLIVPMYNEEAVIPVFFRTIIPILEALPVQWEIICVNDGSRDKTLSLLTDYNKNDARIKVINLSRNFGKENALTAGLDHASGEALIPIDVDLQDPPEFIPIMVNAWLAGADIVNAARKDRQTDTWAKRTTSRYFYRIVNLISNVELAQDVGDYRLISRRAADAVRSLRERRRFMKGLFSWVGFSVETIYYDRAPRAAGTTKWNYWKLWNLALEGITSFSTVPLRIATYLGLSAAVLSLTYALYLVLDTLFFGNPVSGYPSLMTAILFLGGVQLIFIGVVGEYVGRIHEEVKQRPIYIVASTKGF